MASTKTTLDDRTTPRGTQRLVKLTTNDARAEAWTADARIELTVVADGVLRVVHHPPIDWENEPTSYAAVDAKPRGAPWRVDRRRSTLTAGSVQVDVARDPLRLAFADSSGAFLSECAKSSLGYSEAGVTITWQTARTEPIYGLGPYAFAELNRVGQQRRMAAAHAAHTGGDVPIPLFVSPRGYGVLVDNPNVANFDLRRKGRITFTARDGYLSYYVFWGPTVADVLRRYADLTGHPPLPPLWWFGPLFSRVPAKGVPGGDIPGYRTFDELLDLAREFRARGIPADGLVLDFQWDEHISAFAWQKPEFRRARTRLRELRRLGFNTVVILKPAVNVEARTSAQVQRHGLALTRMDGSMHTCCFHQGRSAFLDFFRSSTRAWYGEQLARLIADGVAGWWTDEGDCLGFEPLAVRDLSRSGEGIRNLYNTAWARTVYDGQREATDRRVVNLTRTGTAGIQRFATTLWSGDVSASWACLATQVQTGLSAGLSGVPFWTNDAGGFLGNPTAELYVRWAQFAAFCPVVRFHGCGPREPWHYGPAAERAVRDILRWRMRLLPYIYSTAHRAHTQGTPMMRPMAMAFPRERRFANLANQYLFGDALLVRPITEPMARLRSAGGSVTTELGPGRWVDFWTGQTMPRVRRIATPAKLDTLPIWVRAPSIVVLADPTDHTGRQTWDALTLRVYAGDMRTAWETAFDLYEDDRETYAYERGAARRTRLTAARVTTSAFELRAVPAGRGAPECPVRRRWRVEVVGAPTRPAARFARGDLAFTQDGTTWFTHLPAMRTVTRWTLRIHV